MNRPQSADFEAARLEFGYAVDYLARKYRLSAAEKILLLAVTTASLVSPQVEREQERRAWKQKPIDNTSGAIDQFRVAQEELLRRFPHESMHGWNVEEVKPGTILYKKEDEEAQ